MTTTTILLILAAAASTIAFSPPQQYFQSNNGEQQPRLVPRSAPDGRRRRDAANAGAGSFASSSSSSSGSSAGPGFSTSISSRSGLGDGSQGANALNPSGVAYPGNDFNFPSPAYGNPYQNPYAPSPYVPVDFNALFRQYLEFMQRVAQQTAYSQNGGGFSWNGAWTSPLYYNRFTPPASTYPSLPSFPSHTHYYSHPNSATKHFYSTPSTPKSSARLLLRSGQPVHQHYSKARAQVSFSKRNFTPDQNNFENTVPGGYNGINTRAGFAGPNHFGAPPQQNGFLYPGPNNFGGPGYVSASSSASLGPQGGFGKVSISPPPQGNPELGTRMGSVPASGGGDGTFGVFSSSSSGSSDVNGQKKSYKEATSVINDNGKVTTYHVSDP